jgi:hypothetical protein
LAIRIRAQVFGRSVDYTYIGAATCGVPHVERVGPLLDEADYRFTCPDLRRRSYVGDVFVPGTAETHSDTRQLDVHDTIGVKFELFALQDIHLTP